MKISVLITIGCINSVFALLLIHKQSRIVQELYEIQQLQKERKSLLEMRKNLFLTLAKEQQLSSVYDFATTNLDMHEVPLDKVKTVTL